MKNGVNNGAVSVVIRAILIACVTLHKSNAFTVNNRSVLSTGRRIHYHHQQHDDDISSSYSSVPGKSTVLYAGNIPEPGVCPSCNDANGYWDGSTNFVCIACGNEWLVESQGGGDNDDANDNGGNDSEDGVIFRDSNGNILESGDTVVLTQELGKGLKKGLKVTRIRVGDFGDDHDVQANIPGMGTFNLKSKFLKKTK